MWQASHVLLLLTVCVCVVYNGIMVVVIALLIMVVVIALLAGREVTDWKYRLVIVYSVCCKMLLLDMLGADYVCTMR